MDRPDIDWLEKWARVDADQTAAMSMSPTKRARETLAICAYVRELESRTAEGSLAWALSQPVGTRLTHGETGIEAMLCEGRLERVGLKRGLGGCVIAEANVLTGWSLVEPEIKPCPWCKGTEIVHVDNTGGYNIVCRTCGCRGPTRSTTHYAAEAWNTRKK